MSLLDNMNLTDSWDYNETPLFPTLDSGAEKNLFNFDGNENPFELNSKEENPFEFDLGDLNDDIFGDIEIESIAIEERTPNQWVMDKTREMLDSNKIKATIKYKYGARRDFIILRPHHYDDTKKLIKNDITNFIEDDAGLRGNIELSAEIGERTFSIERTEGFKTLYVNQFYTMGTPNTTIIPFGEHQGEIFLYPLFKRETSILIGGISGSGKSEFMNSIVQALQYNFKDNKEKLRFLMISPKDDVEGNADLRIFKDSPYLFQSPNKLSFISVHGDEDLFLEQANEVIQLTVDIMESKEKKGHQETTHILVFDELERLLKKENKDIEGAKERNIIRDTMLYNLAKIASVGRSSRVRLILGTQSPTRKVLEGLMTNVTVFGGKVSDKTESGILGIPKAYLLGGMGHFAMKGDRGMLKLFQTFMFDRNFLK